MLRTRTGRWTAATLALCVLTLVAAWFTLVEPRRSEAASLSAQNTATQQTNDLLTVRIEQLKAQFAALPTTQTQLAAIRRQLPTDTAMPQLVRDLNAMADATGVTLTTLTPGGGQILAGTGATASSGSGSVAAGAVVAVPLTIVVDGDYFQAVAFLQKLQAGLPRAVLISGVQVGAASSTATASSTSTSTATATASASGTTGRVEVTLSGQVFVMPGAATSTPSPSSTSGATP